MSEFIVLGLIPGTQVQINFAIWTFVASVLIGVYVARMNARTRAVQAWLVATSIVVQTQRQQF
jgi:hypothetical protein